MPREKSEITGSKIMVTIRMTKEQKEMFNAIGGSEWLRKYLNRQIRSEEIQLGVQRNVS